MNYTEFRALFQQTVLLNDINHITNDQIQQFHDFTELLLTVNQRTNLTAIRDIPNIISKHYVDSLLVSEQIPEGATLLDIGCGPGFPSIPLAIARPDLKITSLDSTQKKISFVMEATDRLNLKNVRAISARAEDHSTIAQLGAFDVVVSRAVARLNILSELALPYVKIGGTFIALKSAKAEEELAEAREAVSILGCSPAKILKAELRLAPSESEERNLIIMTKSKKTPPVFPRSFAAIKKKPL